MINLFDLPRTLEEILQLPSVHFIDRSLLPDQPGIYFVIFEAQEQRLAYIGKAESLRKRWFGHHREPEIWLLRSLEIPVDIGWMEVDKVDLSNIEKFLIEVFRPPLNYVHTLEVKRKQTRTINKCKIQTVSEVLQDYRDRKRQAIKLLESDEFWEVCNSEDGDRTYPWIYPDGIVLCEYNNVNHYYDTHPIEPFIVPYPPSFVANNSGAVKPKSGYIATSIERRNWLIDVAQQIDCWLVAVAHYHAAQISSSAVRQTLQVLSGEETLEQAIIGRIV